MGTEMYVLHLVGPLSPSARSMGHVIRSRSLSRYRHNGMALIQRAICIGPITEKQIEYKL